MRASRVVAGLMSAAAVVGLSFVAAPAASAGVTGPLKVELTKGRGIAELTPTHWYVHSTGFEFTVTTTNVGTVNDQIAFVFLSTPSEIDIVGFNSDYGWSCWDVDGGAECQHIGQVAPGEAWPELKVKYIGFRNVSDSIDVYATSEQGVEEAHDGRTFRFDTST